MADPYARGLAAQINPATPAVGPDRRQSMALALMGQTPESAQSNVDSAALFDPAVRGWRSDFTRRFGAQPNMGAGDYNYGLAYAVGARPEQYEHDPGMAHWPSAAPVAPMGDVPLKAPNHPTAWMEGFMQRYGVDPHEAEPRQLIEAMLDGTMPPGGMR